MTNEGLDAIIAVISITVIIGSAVKSFLSFRKSKPETQATRPVEEKNKNEHKRSKENN